jgi:glycosyltransferase involved in cell wall biosynthesis
MRITIVQGPFFPIPPLLGGAVEKAWHSLGSEFGRRGHAVTHISRQYGDLPSDEIIGRVRHLRVRGYDAPKSKILWRLLDLRYALRVLPVLPDADILVTNSIWLPAMVRSPRYGALYVHMGRYPKRQTRLLYHHAARLQTVSNAVSRAIIAQDARSAAKVRVIPYPLAHAVEPIDVSRSWDDRERCILFVGRVHPEKGLELLLAAFRLLVRSGMHDWRLLIVGPWEARLGGGGQGFYETLFRNSQDVADKVDWVGPIFDSNALSLYYKKASLFVYPSLAERGESFGLAPLEAMACGCPALVSALECFKDFVQDGRSGFIFDHRSTTPVQALAGRLKEILANKHDLVSIAIPAHEVAGTFALAKVADLYIQDFAGLLGTHSYLDRTRSSQVA